MKRRDFVAGMPVLALGVGFGAAAITRHEAPRGDIVLAQTADFTAGSAPATRLHAEGAALHFAEVNAAGGVNGRKVRVLRLDHGGETLRAIADVRRLMADPSCFALVHLAGASVCESVLQMVQGSGMPLIHPVTGSDGAHIGRHAREAFFLRACHGREIDRIVGHLRAQAIGGIGFVHDGASAAPSRDALLRSARAQGIEVRAIGVFPSASAGGVCVEPAVAALANAALSAIVIGSAGPAAERFIKEFKSTGDGARLFGFSETRVARLHETLGPLASGMVVAQVMPSIHGSTLPVVRDYRATAESRRSTPTISGLEGYISARVIVQALREAGPQLTRARFLTAMENQSQIGGFPVRDASPHQGSPFVELATMGDDGTLFV